MASGRVFCCSVSTLNKKKFFDLNNDRKPDQPSHNVCVIILKTSIVSKKLIENPISEGKRIFTKRFFDYHVESAVVQAVWLGKKWRINSSSLQNSKCHSKCHLSLNVLLVSKKLVTIEILTVSIQPAAHNSLYLPAVWQRYKIHCPNELESSNISYSPNTANTPKAVHPLKAINLR